VNGDGVPDDAVLGPVTLVEALMALTVRAMIAEAEEYLASLEGES
jgi:hypothetical protein